MSELYHHGVPHQKWGVRRYQNEDGSLTELGKERYRKYQDAHNKAVTVGLKKPMSSAEIMANINEDAKRRKMKKVASKIDVAAYRKSVLGEEKNSRYEAADRKLKEAWSTAKLKAALKDLEDDVGYVDKKYTEIVKSNPKYSKAEADMYDCLKELEGVPYSYLLYPD